MTLPICWRCAYRYCTSRSETPRECRDAALKYDPELRVGGPAPFSPVVVCAWQSKMSRREPGPEELDEWGRTVIQA